MEAKVVLDISSIVWDKNHFKACKSYYHILKEEVFLFINAFKNCHNLQFVAREELLDEIRTSFPYEICCEHHLYDFQKLILQFLATQRKISYGATTSNITATPSIYSSYFSDNLQTEIGYLITEIHKSSDNYFFCTFRVCWQNNLDLQTNNSDSKTHKTVIHESAMPTIHDYYLDNIRNIFEHHSKHDSNRGIYYLGAEKVNPLSCYDERQADPTIPQQFLDDAILYENDYFNFDDNNQTFIRFRKHEGNKYHGYDEDKENVPRKIRERFHK